MQGEGRRFGFVASARAALVSLLLAPCAAHAHSVHPHSTAAGDRAEIRDASLASSSNSAALTLELNRTTRYRLSTLAAPGRVVIDLGEARFVTGAHLPHAGGIIQSVRAGSRPHDGLRIVLQLDSSAAPHGRVRLPVKARWRHGCASATSCLVVMIGTAAGDAKAAGAADVASTAAASHASEAKPTSAAVKRVNGTPADLPAVLRPIRAPHAPVLADRDVVIAVDAGHGGKDPGAIGRSGTEEKNVTLAIARALAERIDEQPGMRAVLTRDADVFLLLRERMDKARAAHADLFVSVHADSIRDRTVSGSSVYVLSEHGATSEAARVLAERENSADLLGGLPLAGKSNELKSVLLDLAQTASISASMTAAQGVLAALDHVGEVRKPRVQQAGFVVLKSPAMPSMLVETAYISNPVDEQRLRTGREQRKLADAIFAGLLGYFEQNPPSGTRFARLNEGSRDVLAAAPGAPPSGGQAAVPPTSRLGALETP